MELFKKLLALVLRWFGKETAPPPSLPDVKQPPEDVEDADTEDTEPRDTLPESDAEEDEMPARPELKRGDKGDLVKELQGLLKLNGEGLSADGDFGPGTEKALVSFQTSYGLKGAGVCDAETWAVLDRPAFWKDPGLAGVALEAASPLDSTSGVAKSWNAYGGLLEALAALLGMAPSAAVAVLMVESGGKGFIDGKMVIRFENHIFYSRWGKAHLDTFQKHFKFDSDQRWKGHYWRADANGEWVKQHTTSGSKGQAAEYDVLGFARSLADEEALLSISMGSAQVMGFNAAKVGYGSAREMFDAWSEGDRPQILGLFDFIRSNHRMVRALRADDWVGFARYYNGGGQADYYGGHIEEAVEDAQAAGIA